MSQRGGDDTNICSVRFQDESAMLNTNLRLKESQASLPELNNIRAVSHSSYSVSD